MRSEIGVCVTFTSSPPLPPSLLLLPSLHDELLEARGLQCPMLSLCLLMSARLFLCPCLRASCASTKLCTGTVPPPFSSRLPWPALLTKIHPFVYPHTLSILTLHLHVCAATTTGPFGKAGMPGVHKGISKVHDGAAKAQECWQNVHRKQNWSRS